MFVNVPGHKPQDLEGRELVLLPVRLVQCTEFLRFTARSRAWNEKSPPVLVHTSKIGRRCDSVGVKCGGNLRLVISRVTQAASFWMVFGETYPIFFGEARGLFLFF